MKIQVTISEITQEDLVNLFSTAFYGSNYLSADYEEATEYDEEDCYEEIMAKILLNGGKIYVTDGYADGCHYGNLEYQFNEDYDATYTLRLEDVTSGLEKAANGTFNVGENDEFQPDWRERNIRCGQRSFYSFVNEDEEWDATRADILMQIILFDEIIYG